MNTLEMVSHETMVFMRGKYRLDEIGDGKDELKFKQGQKTVLTIYIHEDKYTFLIIFGKKEREIFELQRQNFSYQSAEPSHVFKEDNTKPQNEVVESGGVER